MAFVLLLICQMIMYAVCVFLELIRDFRFFTLLIGGSQFKLQGLVPHNFGIILRKSVKYENGSVF